MKVRSVNVGQPRENPWKAMKLTGIDKRPVAGPVMVRAPRGAGAGRLLPRLLVADALDREFKEIAGRRTA